MMSRLHLALLPITVALSTGCISNTQVQYFPDQRGPIYCSLLQGNVRPVRPQSNLFEPVALSNWPGAFALRNPASNEAVIVVNEANVREAIAQPLYERSWGKDKLVGVRLLLQIDLAQDSITSNHVRSYLANQFPGIQISNTVAADVLLQVFSIWVGSEYLRTPCDGVMQTNIPFELLLPPVEGARFLMDDSNDLQLAGMILYTDTVTGWKFHKSYTVSRQQFKVRPQ